MNKTDYNKIFEQTAAQLKEKKKLLLHACCAPCSTAVLERVTPYFDVTLFFYNPNIDTKEEYFKRADELFKLKNMFDVKEIIIPEFEPSVFQKAVQGLWDCPEGGLRCGICFDLRLSAAAEKAKEISADFFATTLTVSPHKNPAIISVAGSKAAEALGVPYLYSDFKKKEGYKRSIELSEVLKLYRQNYCGCRF